jgi:PPOX class probable F420-dependent enzyme
MPTPPLPDSLVAILERPNPAVMATVKSDGAPVTVATWYLWVDGRVLLNVDAARVRLKHVTRDPRVSLTVLDGDSWYRHVTLHGRVAEILDDEGLADIDRLSVHYLGSPYGNRGRRRVSLWMEVESWFAWNGGHAWDGS